jgi:hypothetical protein
MTDCLYPHRCAHLRSGTRGGEPCDWCGNHKNTAGLLSAPICKTTGWYESIADARARSVHEQIGEKVTIPRSTPDSFARQALMTGKAE